MKRIATTIALLFVLSLAACGDDAESKTGSNNSNNTSQNNTGENNTGTNNTGTNNTGTNNTGTNNTGTNNTGTNNTGGFDDSPVTVAECTAACQAAADADCPDASQTCADDCGTTIEFIQTSGCTAGYGIINCGIDSADVCAEECDESPAGDAFVACVVDYCIDNPMDEFCQQG